MPWKYSNGSSTSDFGRSSASRWTNVASSRAAGRRTPSTRLASSWRNIERKTSLSTCRSSTWRRLSIASRTSSYGMPYDRITSPRPTSDGSNSFTVVSPAWSGVRPEWCRHSPLMSECTKDRSYRPFCSSSAWTPSPLTFSRLTRGRSCSPMTFSWPKNNVRNSKKKPSSGTIDSASTACTWTPRRRSTWNAACKPTEPSTPVEWTWRKCNNSSTSAPSSAAMMSLFSPPLYMSPRLDKVVAGNWCHVRPPYAFVPQVENLQTVVRPVALLYGSKSWPTTAKHEQALHVMEMRMLRWSLQLNTPGKKT